MPPQEDNHLPRISASDDGTPSTHNPDIAHNRVDDEDEYSAEKATAGRVAQIPVSGVSVAEAYPTFIDVKFPTWSLRAEMRVPDSPVPSLPPLPSLSQPLFPPSKDHGRLLEIRIPALTDPNSPYVPWDSPARQEFLLRSPPSSHFNRPLSRANAPEPVIPTPTAHYNTARPPRIKRVLRSFGRNVSGAFRRIGKPRQAVPQVQVNSFAPEPWQSQHSIAAQPPSRLRRLPSVSACSMDSNNTDSLGNWLAHRRQKQLDHGDTVLMSFDDYERRGSWMGTADACGLADCSVHHRPRTPSISSIMTHDSLYRVAVTHRSRRSSVSVSIRSKRSVSRMSLTRRGPPPLRLSQLGHSSSFIVDSPLRLTSESPPRLAPMAEQVNGESSLSQEITATLRRSESTSL